MNIVKSDSIELIFWDGSINVFLCLFVFLSFFPALSPSETFTRVVINSTRKAPDLAEFQAKLRTCGRQFETRHRCVEQLEAPAEHDPQNRALFRAYPQKLKGNKLLAFSRDWTMFAALDFQNQGGVFFSVFQRRCLCLTRT